mmetsp:Transcript_22761/g.33039  ORF Transcript_22761/g.33039 Transcript_22761/m.33039 type:complete len:83 (-) Transcript_22761:1243-1491(-)
MHILGLLAIDLISGQERIHQNDVRNIITQAFQQWNSYKDLYMTVVQDSHNKIFQSLIDVHVITNIDLFDGDDSPKKFFSSEC